VPERAELAKQDAGRTLLARRLFSLELPRKHLKMTLLKLHPIWSFFTGVARFQYISKPLYLLGRPVLRVFSAGRLRLERALRAKRAPIAATGEERNTDRFPRNNGKKIVCANKRGGFGRRLAKGEIPVRAS